MNKDQLFVWRYLIQRLITNSVETVSSLWNRIEVPCTESQDISYALLVVAGNSYWRVLQGWLPGFMRVTSGPIYIPYTWLPKIIASVNIYAFVLHLDVVGLIRDMRSLRNTGAPPTPSSEDWGVTRVKCKEEGEEVNLWPGTTKFHR
jgi:hypothetical protein